MKILFIFLAFSSLILFKSVNAAELFSKDDAATIFNQSFSDWTTNLLIAEKSGISKTVISGKNEWTMIVDQGHSVLKITPSFVNEEHSKPNKISVAVEQRQMLSSFTISRSDKELQALIAKWHSEMLPQYTVMTEIDLRNGITQFNFSIFEYGRYSIMDSLGKDVSGCWQVCVKR